MEIQFIMEVALERMNYLIKGDEAITYLYSRKFSISYR